MSFQLAQKIGFQVGQQVGNYEFLDVLSSSSSEVAYKVRNHLTQRLEALKVLAADAGEDRETAERFIREIKVHARLLHPNIVTFYNAAELDGQLVMTTELVEGITLAERVKLMGSLSWIEAVSHISQILQALAFAHEQGIIHRNVTPETIIITADTTVKLNGFDLAKPIASPSLTQTGSVLGALGYIPPEQIRGLGPLDARSDLYSVGVVLYEALTGRLPFDSGSQFKIMMDHVNSEAPAPSSINPKLPAEFDAVVLKALAKNPADRFQTAEEFRARLEALKSTLRTRPGAAHADPLNIDSPAARRSEYHPAADTAGDLCTEAPVPDFGMAAVSGSGRRSFLLLILGVSSLLVGVIVALLLAVAKL
ncbi:MAG TPA: protein kinase [Bryobacteraceae bacterium]|nr:protein kinase [Bryobacteraceae bacterium]